MTKAGEQHPRGPRASRPKYKTGCVTCKERRIRCDQSRPTCRKCWASGRHCKGYASVWRVEVACRQSDEVSSSEILPTASRCEDVDMRADCQPVDDFFVVPTKTELFRNAQELTVSRLSLLRVPSEDGMLAQYFQLMIIPQLANGLEVDFWATSGWYLVTTEPAVLHAALAVATAHNAYLSDSPALNHGYKAQNFALHHYNAAVRLLRGFEEANEGSRFIMIMTSCILFACFEILRNNIATAICHIKGGMKILQEKLVQRSNSSADRTLLDERSAEFDAIRLIFARLLHQVSFMKKSSLANSNGKNGQNRIAYVDLTQMLTAPHPFESAQVADAYRDCLRNRNMRLMPHSQNWIYGVDAETLNQWEHSLVNGSMSSDCSRTTLGGKDYSPSGLLCTSVVSILRVKQMCSDVLKVQDRFGIKTEMAYDECIPQFKEIVDRLTALLNPLQEITTTCGAHIIAPIDSRYRSGHFGLRSEFNIPLFLVAWKCREPRLRRRAIGLLQMRNAREGLWDSRVLARIAKDIVTLEEASTSNARSCNDVPAAFRVHAVGLVDGDDSTRKGIILERGQRCT